MESSAETVVGAVPGVAAGDSQSVGPGPSSRPEAEVFSDLEALCTSAGYVYALAVIHLTNDTIFYNGKLKPDDLLPSYSWSRLIRSELSTLFGLMIKKQVSYEFQGNEVTGKYIDQTFRLMEELHRAIDGPGKANFVEVLKSGGDLDSVMTHGKFLREAMFYGSESAFSFQYIDLAKEKYQADNSWLLQNKSFTIEDAAAVVAALTSLQPDHIIEVMRAQRPPGNMDFALAALGVRTDDLAQKSGVARERVDAVIAAFCVEDGERNCGYKTVSDFNVVNATPLLRLPDGRVVNFHATSLGAALYEAPFFWTVKDKAYFHGQAQANRGDFAEKFCARRLELVFGADRVFTNVLLKDSQGSELGEIDILVRYGNRALIFQVKSKRLTLEAQKGIEEKIRDDFQKGVQKAYDQGFNCASLLQSGSCTAIGKDGTVFGHLDSVRHFYPLCVLSDHYPALAHQARHLIEIREQEGIKAPFVLDIFMIDEMTEILPSPLYFLSYVDRRVGYDDRVMASNEHVLFAYHLKQNLWLEKDVGVAGLMDDWGVELDVAMVARRTGVPGAKIPKGILTAPRRTKVGELIQLIEDSDDSVVTALGLFLLTMGEAAVTECSKGIDKIVTRARRDGRIHDFSMGMKDSSEGLTIHCSNLPANEGKERLIQHSAKRKYLDEKDVWFGVWIGPGKINVRLVAELKYEWKLDANLFAAISTGAWMPYPEDCVAIWQAK
jgi:hypothetical protein